MRLDEAFEGIITNITEMLEAETQEGHLLEEIEEVVRGDRARPRPRTPSLWVFAERANPTHTPSSMQESWELPIVLTPVIKTDLPEEGYKEASELAAKARSILLKNRTLNLREVVQDTRSGRYEPSAPWHNEGQLYSAVAVVIVTFRIREFC